MTGFFGEIALLAATFSVAALAVGRLAASLAPRTDRSGCAIECAVCNIPIAILLTRDIVSDAGMLGFFVGYFLIHAPILVAYSVATRRGRSPFNADSA